MLQSMIDSSNNEQRDQLCTEAACVLIDLVRMIICKVKTQIQATNLDCLNELCVLLSSEILFYNKNQLII